MAYVVSKGFVHCVDSTLYYQLVTFTVVDISLVVELVRVSKLESRSLGLVICYRMT
jgi:hypothetical protein